MGPQTEKSDISEILHFSEGSEIYFETKIENLDLSKATRLKAAKLDLSKASDRMKDMLQASGVLQRPALKKISSAKLRALGRVCGLPHLSEVGEDGDIVS